MVTVSVLLSGKLRVNGFGKSVPIANDGTYPLTLRVGSTVRAAIDGMGIPAGEVDMTMLNGRQCPVDSLLKPGDRVMLIPADVAALWRTLGRQNLGLGIGLDS